MNVARGGPAPASGTRLAQLPAGIPAVVLLPLRLFAGVTFLYAGVDKLIDPTFFDAASPASIQAQFIAFERTSPLAGLVHLAEPWALAIGLLISLAEIAIGIGALTGLAFRIAAGGGFVLSLLFWLTASWSVHPYYYGPDLPYAAGWLTLALAGHGDLLVPARLRTGTVPARPLRSGGAAASPERRALLEAGVLGAVALVVASLTIPFRGLTSSGTDDVTGAGDGLESPGPSASAAAAGSSPPDATAGASPAGSGARSIATVAAVQRRGAVTFTVPFDAPAPLPAGDPGVVVRLTNGTFRAYDATCTHEGCPVEWDAADRLLVCPCHGATFDPANAGAVLAGPTRQPLAELPIVVDQASGEIRLRA